MALSRQIEPEAVPVIESMVAARTKFKVTTAGGNVTDTLGAVWPSMLAAVARRAHPGAIAIDTR